MKISIRGLFLSIQNRKNARQRYESILQESFGHLSSLIIDAFFANFGYAMALSLISKIDLCCRTLKPDLVIEFGSGLSTVVITEALAATESLIVSVDESMKWLADTYRLVRHPAKTIFICAPVDKEEGNLLMLSKVLSPKAKPGLVIIDGPSGRGRFSEVALRLYQELLSPGCICAVDDTDREENDVGASQLAADFSLLKFDYGDPIYVHHKYSILCPSYLADSLFLASPQPHGVIRDG
jgi:hypothetical protein